MGHADSKRQIWSCLASLTLRLSGSAYTNLQRVFNGIWEVFEGADGDGLLRWILTGAVGLGEERDHNLDIAFGTQSAWFQ